MARKPHLRRFAEIYDRVMGFPVPMWLVLLIVTLGAVGTVSLAGAVQYDMQGGKRLGRLGSFAVSVANVPNFIRTAISQSLTDPGSVNGNPFPGQHGLVRSNFHDDGYLLLAAMGDNTSIIRLIRLRDGAVIHSWRPDFGEIVRRAPNAYSLEQVDKSALFRAIHPLLMEDGGLVFHDQEGPLVRINACSKIIWELDLPFHHALEIDADGNIWANQLLHPSTLTASAHAGIRDDAIVQVSPQGQVLFTKSMGQALIKAGHGRLLTRTAAYPDDPVHQNQAFPARYSSEYWRKGDILVSMAHAGIILIYRPTEDRIVWLKKLPHAFQHDAEFVGSSRISLLSNYPVDGVSEVLTYDFTTDAFSRRHQKTLAGLQFVTATEGRATPLPNGDTFIEETNRGRLFRIADDGVRWILYNRQSSNEPLRMLNWSRYLSASQIQPLIAKLQCHS